MSGGVLAWIKRFRGTVDGSAATNGATTGPRGAAPTRSDIGEAPTGADGAGRSGLAAGAGWRQTDGTGAASPRDWAIGLDGTRPSRLTSVPVGAAGGTAKVRGSPPTDRAPPSAGGLAG